ncbi:MAG: MgtC/SapB family protein [Firmicutes bacterium]|nr:MgtC/SapB family protein [Bacillota bacterium]
MNLPLLSVFLRLITSFLLSGLIGLERESHGRPAGFRTHILVGLGSTLIMIISAYGFNDLGISYDPGRMAAQVISGVGFLGAGTILREGVNIRGLTTAASLWSVAGIGLAVGIGLYAPAIITTLFIIGTLILLKKFDPIHALHTLKITTIDQPAQLVEVFAVLADHNISVKQMMLTSGENTSLHLELIIDTKNKKQIEKLLVNLNEIKEVSKAFIE